MSLNMLESFLERLWSAFGDRRRLKLAVHRGYLSTTGRECYFINATNLSRNRDLEITHVWFDSVPQVHALQPERPLPKRLKPDEAWETWVEVEWLPAAVRDNPYDLARARLSTGRIVRSRRNHEYPPVGSVPGDPARAA